MLYNSSSALRNAQPSTYKDASQLWVGTASSSSLSLLSTQKQKQQQQQQRTRRVQAQLAAVQRLLDEVRAIEHAWQQQQNKNNMNGEKEKEEVQEDSKEAATNVVVTQVIEQDCVSVSTVSSFGHPGAEEEEREKETRRSSSRGGLHENTLIKQDPLHDDASNEQPSSSSPMDGGVQGTLAKVTDKPLQKHLKQTHVAAAPTPRSSHARSKKPSVAKTAGTGTHTRSTTTISAVAVAEMEYVLDKRKMRGQLKHVNILAGMVSDAEAQQEVLLARCSTMEALALATRTSGGQAENELGKEQDGTEEAHRRRTMCLRALDKENDMLRQTLEQLNEELVTLERQRAPQQRQHRRAVAAAAAVLPSPSSVLSSGSLRGKGPHPGRSAAATGPSQMLDTSALYLEDDDMAHKGRQCEARLRDAAQEYKELQWSLEAAVARHRGRLEARQYLALYR